MTDSERITELERKVFELAACESIRQRFMDFCLAMARADVQLAMSVFSPNARDIHPPLGTWVREEMPERLSSAFDTMFHDAQYFANPMRIEIAGDSAKSETTVWCAKRVPDRDEFGYTYLRLSGMVYFDDWKPVDGQWLIAERRFVPTWELFHSIGAESKDITRAYKAVSPDTASGAADDMDYRAASAVFWGDL